MKRLLFVIGLVGILLAPVMSEALLVTVDNSGFEAPVLSEGESIVGFGSADEWTATSKKTSKKSGIWNPTSADFSVAGNVAWLKKGAAIDQALDYLVVEGTTLTLNVDIGLLGGKKGSKKIPQYEIQLFAGNTLLASHSSTVLTKGGFVTAALTYEVLAGNPLIGQEVSILLANSKGSGAKKLYFDNVILNNDPYNGGTIDNGNNNDNGNNHKVPEPSTLLLLGAGLLGFGVFARKIKK